MKLHDYQEYAVKFIEEHKIAALLLDMGLGKTITTLTAINNLMYDLFEVRKVLIIALVVVLIGIAVVAALGYFGVLFK